MRNLLTLSTPTNGELDVTFNDSRKNGVASKSGCGMDVEFPHQMLAMLLDGLRADAEFRCGLFVGFAFRDQLQHFSLA
jgi:hypothetical protein